MFYCACFCIELLPIHPCSFLIYKKKKKSINIATLIMIHFVFMFRIFIFFFLYSKRNITKPPCGWIFLIGIGKHIIFHGISYKTVFLCTYIHPKHIAFFHKIKFLSMYSKIIDENLCAKLFHLFIKEQNVSKK